MLASLKMHGVAQAVGELTEQASPAFEAAIPVAAETNRRSGLLPISSRPHASLLLDRRSRQRDQAGEGAAALRPIAPSCPFRSS